MQFMRKAAREKMTREGRTMKKKNEFAVTTKKPTFVSVYIRLNLNSALIIVISVEDFSVSV